MQNAVFERIAGDLRGMRREKHLMVGINGIDTAGKTTFAISLAEFLTSHDQRVQLIHLDDFLNVSGLRSKGADPIQAYIDNAFNLNLLIEKLLEPMRHYDTVRATLRLLNLETDRMDRVIEFHIDQSAIVILEGVLLYRKPLDTYFDYRVYLDIPFNEVLRRASIRDLPRFGDGFLDRYRQKYLPIQEWYSRECNPQQKSDLVIDNTDYEHPRVLTID